MLEERRARLGLWPHLRLGLGLLLYLVVAFLELLHVGQHKLGLDDLGVAHRIDRRRLVAALLHVDDVVVLEAPHYMENRVALSYVGEELVPEAFALRRALNETGDIGEIDRRANHLLGMDYLGKLL